MFPHNSATAKPPAGGSSKSGADFLREDPTDRWSKKQSGVALPSPARIWLSSRTPASTPSKEPSTSQTAAPPEAGTASIRDGFLEAGKACRRRLRRNTLAAGILVSMGLMVAVYAGITVGGKVFGGARRSKKVPIRLKYNLDGDDFIDVPEVGPHGDFPPLEESTVLFLHVFKCAGSTLRRMLVDWAEEGGNSGAFVTRCENATDIATGNICLHRYKLVDEDIQKPFIAQQKVIAGHFLWGFQLHVQTPTLMISALRNPLELFVSSQQYLHSDLTKPFSKAHVFVAGIMNRTITTGGPEAIPGTWKNISEVDVEGDLSANQVPGFIRRFVGADRKRLGGEKLQRATTAAMENLESFWVLGVVEQYAGFEEVLKRLLDPEGKHEELWKQYSDKHVNSSRFKSSDLLKKIDDNIIRQFNATLGLQWEMYHRAVELWDARCRQVLPASDHDRLCTVPPPPERY